MKINLLVLYLLIIVTKANSQTYDNLVILDMQFAGGETTMIDYNGKVLKEFSPEEKVKITNEIRRTYSTLSNHGSFVTYNFSDGLLPVQTGDNWKLYDKNGRVTIDLGNQFYSLSKPSEGIYKVYEKIQNGPRGFWIYYIKENGDKLFNGKRFWEATLFINDIAFAQMDDKNGPWVILNSKTGTIKVIPQEISLMIKKIERKTKNRSIASLNSNNKYAKVLIDNNANILFEANKATGIRNAKIHTITDKTIVCSRDNDYYVFDSLFNRIESLFPVKNMKSLNSNMYFTKYHPYYNNLQYLNKQNVNLNLNEGNIFLCEHLDQKWIGGILSDTINRISNYVIYERRTLELKIKSEKPIAAIIGERLIEYDPQDRFNHKLVSIHDLNGKILYKVDPITKIHKGVKLADFYDDKDIYHLEVNEDEDITNLKKYINLRSIKFSNFAFTELPNNIKELSNIEEIKLFKCKKLNQLPNWLANFEKLKSIRIEYCNELKEIEEIIPKLKQLTKLYTMNYKFESGFETNMKKENTNLEISSWYGN